MVSKIAFLILTYLGLVHAFPYNNYDIKSLQQENSRIVQALTQKIIVKRDDISSSYAQQNGLQPLAYSSFSASLPTNNCDSGTVKAFGNCRQATILSPV